MGDNSSTNIDTEFRRYLQILESYIGRITNTEVLKKCKNWILRLSVEDVAGEEQPLRNKYIFTLCYQLATGALHAPFLREPPAPPQPLEPLAEQSDESLTDLECVYIDFEDKISDPSIKDFIFGPEQEICTSSCQLYDTVKWMNSDRHIETKNGGVLSKPSDFQDVNQIYAKQSCSQHTARTDRTERTDHTERTDDWRNATYSSTSSDLARERYKLPTSTKNLDTYEQRISNLIFKLRNIKNENVLLHKKIDEMQNVPSKEIITTEKVDTVDRSTSSNNMYTGINDGPNGVEFLKDKIKEMQEYRSTLINTIACLQENIQYFEDVKQQEIDDLKANHKLEMIRVKSTVRTDIKGQCERNIEDIKKTYEEKIAAMQAEASKEFDEMVKLKDSIINEKENEIKMLKSEVEESKAKLKDISDDSNHSYKVQQLQKKLSRTEKSKMKHAQAYKTRLSLLQREKMILEYAMQLQLVRQRAQLVNEAVDDRHAVINRSLDKLENKYKDIIANMQAVAIQRRIQDQKVLDGILQTAFRMFPTDLAPPPPGGPSVPATHSRATNIPARKQNMGTSFELGNELSYLLQSGQFGNTINEAANKSLGQENLIAGYCLNSERLGELFQRVCIPQKDTGDGLQK